MSGWGWDPFLVLGLDHDPGLRDRQVRHALRVRLARIRPRAGDRDTGAEAARVLAAFAALRTRARRLDVLADLCLNPDRCQGLALPGLADLAQAKLPAMPHTASADEVQWVWFERGLGREAAGLRLERAAAGVPPWPRTWLGRSWLRLRYGDPARLGVRAALAVAVPLLAHVLAPGSSSVPALVVGAATWLVLTGRWELALRCAAARPAPSAS